MPRRESDELSATKALLHRALDLPRDDRRSFLEGKLGPGPELEEAWALLENVEELDGFLEAPHGKAQAFTPAIPERIAGFEVERVLGWGSMGVVYLARQAEPARPVALKLLRLDAGSEATAERFRREAALLARLAHPNIATVHASGVADLGAGEQPWFSMEYVEGQALTAHAEARELDRDARLRLVVEVARALQHAHERGVVHRDLKPENVLVRSDGRPCVLDFGVAALASAEESLLTLTATGQVVGTLAYMAPEQARGGEVGAAADQYALGAMLHELLTGELPLPVRGRPPVEALRLVADGEWRPPTRHDGSLPADLLAVLATVLAPEPQLRYGSVGALADDLERFLAGRPVNARPPSPLRGVARFLRRHPLLVTGAALAFLLLGGLGAFALQALLDKEREAEVSLFFSDRALLDGLVAEAQELWPLAGVPAERFDEWLSRAEGLVQRLDRHRELAEGFVSDSGPSGTRVGDELGDAWLSGQAAELVEGIEAFAAGTIAELRARRELAERLERETVTRYEDVWREAAARVAADPRFDGLDLPPQVGLVPLGPDPRSGLEEFAAYGTGAIPSREAESGRLVARVGEAVVLVLIPGGDYRIGMRVDQLPDRSYVDDAWVAAWHEGPPFSARLEPFLIGKFELTQDQWERATGVNPSDWEPGSVFYGVPVGPTHPVETLSWQQAVEVLPRWGLRLPTEAQWEVAARSGDPPGGLLEGRPIQGPERFNIHTDTKNYDELGFLPGDGYHTHMPVDGLEPNEYGLHHVIGNVWEYCADVYKVRYHDLQHRPGDGLVLAEPDGDVSRRGGGSRIHPQEAFVHIRGNRRFDAGDALTGLRPARALVR